MHKDNLNIRALKLLNSFCPSYFPFLLLKSFFEKFSPYFNLYLSAEIVNEIAGGKSKDRLMLLVIVTVFGNFAIAVIGGILSRIFVHKGTLLSQKEAAYYNLKTLTLDYGDMEVPEIRQLRRKIEESGMIDGHGKQLLLLSVGRLINITINAILALVLGIEMFFIMFSSGFSWYTILLALLITGIVVFNVWYSFRVNNKMCDLSQKVSYTMIDENRIDEAVDCYNMGKDVRLYRQDKLIMKIKKIAFGLHKKAFRMMASKRYTLSIPLHLTEVVLSASIYAFICAYALIGIFGVGSIVKYVGFVESIIGCITSYFGVLADIKNNTPFVSDYLAYFDIPRKMYQGTIPIEKSCFCENDDNDYEIEFQNVSFKYPGCDEYALNDINIKFKVGQRIAVVGMNGSGKTTFIKLMCRLYDPTEGCIRLNGIDIRKYDYDEYLSLFSVVFQDFKLFSFTLGQNIAASTEYNSEKVLACISEAGLANRMSAMPNGLETYLYRDFDREGVEVSGGEAQKIALARALYKGAPFVILDEPTAAFDPISEYEIYSQFNNIAGNKTTVYISHRLASCRFCDQIAVFHEGSIVQIGSHRSLLSDLNGQYYKLWNAQAQYYVT